MKQIGIRTKGFTKNIYIGATASVVGKKEGQGPLAKGFDMIFEDELCSETSFEKAESFLQKTAVELALKKSNLKKEQIENIFAGDLLNQCIGSTYGLRDFGIPFIGLYGACSTMALSLGVASVFVESGLCTNAIAVTSSHFCSSERQFRFPLEYGGQRTQNAQWTVTGSGAAVVSSVLKGPIIKEVTFGKIVDLGVKDMSNMGAAMAPAAADTISAFLKDTKTNPQDYDLILTGDLGKVGSDLLHQLLAKSNIILPNHNDCGLMIFDREKQDVHSGGSGCGCSASVVCSKIFNDLKDGKLKNVLFCATGALMSPTSSQQGETIPAIAHLLHISNS